LTCPDLPPSFSEMSRARIECFLVTLRGSVVRWSGETLARGVDARALRLRGGACRRTRTLREPHTRSSAVALRHGLVLACSEASRVAGSDAAPPGPGHHAVAAQAVRACTSSIACRARRRISCTDHPFDKASCNVTPTLCLGAVFFWDMLSAQRLYPLHPLSHLYGS
jgi:hypothetical protein